MKLPYWLDRDQLHPPFTDERVLGLKELARYVAPYFNQAGLGPESPREERQRVYSYSLKLAVGNGSILAPRRYKDGWVICTRYKRPN